MVGPSSRFFHIREIRGKGSMLKSLATKDYDDTFSLIKGKLGCRIGHVEVDKGKLVGHLGTLTRCAWSRTCKGRT